MEQGTLIDFVTSLPDYQPGPHKHAHTFTYNGVPCLGLVLSMKPLGETLIIRPLDASHDIGAGCGGSIEKRFEWVEEEIVPGFKQYKRSFMEQIEPIIDENLLARMKIRQLFLTGYIPPDELMTIQHNSQIELARKIMDLKWLDHDQ